MSSDGAGDANNPQRKGPAERMTVQDFTVLRAVGEGNMGKVYLVKKNNHDNQEKPLAMKVMRKEEKRMHRLLRARQEAEILSVLDHPFLPSLVASFECDVHFCIVTKYCLGGDLNVLRHRLPDRKFSETAARFYAAEVLVALEYLHGLGIVYRDLKPENVLVQESGHILLTDFDLAMRLPPAKFDQEVQCQCVGNLFAALHAKNRCGDRADSAGVPRLVSRSNPATVSPGAPSHLQGLLGTEEYIAPEVLLGRSYGFHVDWWTLGIFLHELVFGKTPFRGRDRSETFQNILNRKVELPRRRRPVHDLIARLLVKEPSGRLGSSSSRGVEDIKRHSFFEPLRWDSLHHVCRPPYIPAPLSLEGAASKQEVGLTIEP